MTTRDEVFRYYGWQPCVIGDQCSLDECRIPEQMADEIVRLRERIAAVEAERDQFAIRAICAAVAAAEQEVGRE